MLIFTLAFLAGCSLLQFFRHFPSISGIGVLLLFYIAIFSIINRARILLLGLALGFTWTWLYASHHLQFNLPAEWENQLIEIQGTISSIPETSQFLSSFLFHTKIIQGHAVSTKVRLNWQQPIKQVRAGDRWRFTVKLKRIHGTANPNSFNYEAWAFQNGIRANGNVVAKSQPIYLSHSFISHLITQLRQQIYIRVLNIIPHTRASPWLLALIVGERQGIPPSEWEVLRNTGCNHLMAIGGLHIGFMAGIAYMISQWLWRRRTNCLLIAPATTIGSLAALVIAWFYSLLAGFSIPTQRASLMLTLFLLARLQQRTLSAWQSWSIALLVTLMINPLNVLSGSLWLSFGTLALLIYGMNGRAVNNIWWRWGRAQWVIAIGLLPLSLWLFNQYSLVSFIANTIAIPWVGFLVLPFCFMSIVFLPFPFLSKLILMLADKNLNVLWSILVYLSHISWATWIQSLPNYRVLFSTTIGIIILLLPAGFKCRFLGLLWVLPLLFYKPVILDQGQAKFSLLDVGQGLSAVVLTKNHALVFDTGARSANHNMGESIVLPYLYSQGIKKLDVMVISHGDNDHSGGAYSILDKISVETIYTSVPQLFASSYPQLCLAGTHWEWDGVEFKFLYPTLEQLNLGNNSSCVLMITVGKKIILLPGDIEKNAEQFLLNNYQSLKAHILVAPHHGSSTSNLQAFVVSVHPDFVLYATGYLNRYHFPHNSTFTKYQALGALQYETAKTGAVEFILNDDDGVLPQVYRWNHPYYWQDGYHYKNLH
jgi:competence protein ComEC